MLSGPTHVPFGASDWEDRWQAQADEEAEQELRALVQLLDNFMQRSAIDFSEGAANGAPEVPIGAVESLNAVMYAQVSICAAGQHDTRLAAAHHLWGVGWACQRTRGSVSPCI